MKRMVAKACRSLVQSRHPTPPPSWLEGTVLWPMQPGPGHRRRERPSGYPRGTEGDVVDSKNRGGRVATEAGASAVMLKMEPNPVDLAEGQPDQGRTDEWGRPRSTRDDGMPGVIITSSADESERDATARATPLGDRRIASAVRAASRAGPVGGEVVAEPQGDLELAMLNRLDLPSHPALQDWSAGDSIVVRIPWPPAGLERTTPEWRRRSAQALAFLLGGREGIWYGDWDAALEERPKCLLDLPDTSTRCHSHKNRSQERRASVEVEMDWWQRSSSVQVASAALQSECGRILERQLTGGHGFVDLLSLEPRQRMEYEPLTSMILLGWETAVRVDTGHRHILEGIGPTAPPSFALPPAVGTCASLFHHPSSSVAAWPLPSDCVSGPEGAYRMERGRSGDNRGPRLPPIFLGPSGRYKESLARSSRGRTLAPWDASGETRGRNHRYTSPSLLNPTESCRSVPCNGPSRIIHIIRGNATNWWGESLLDWRGSL